MYYYTITILYFILCHFCDGKAEFLAAITLLLLQSSVSHDPHAADLVLRKHFLLLPMDRNRF